MRSKIESVVQSKALTGSDADTQDPTKGRREDPKGSKEECNKAEPKVAEALKENLKKHEQSATAYIHGADEKDTDSEGEPEDEAEIQKTENKNSQEKDGVDKGKNGS